MRPRLRRLNADYCLVSSTFAGANPYIQLVRHEGDPPERYVFDIHVASLTCDQAGIPRPSDRHQMEVILPLEYPRRPPFCRMLTPVFHPNIDPAKICIGDHWSAGQSLAHLVLRIAEMLCFQSYNVKSPLNAAAAAWAEANMAKLPLVQADLSIGL